MAQPLERLRELYAQRDPLYRQTAHYVIETGRPSVGTLVNMIVMQLDLRASRRKPPLITAAGAPARTCRSGNAMGRAYR